MDGPGQIPDLTNAHAARARLSIEALNLSRQFQVGMQVELIPTRALGRGLVEIQVRPSDASTVWITGIQARLSGVMPEANSGQAAMPMRAEVIATRPILSLRLIPQAAQTLPNPSHTLLAEGRAWLDQQFRQFWPSAQPLASTLARLAAQFGLSDLGNQSQGAIHPLFSHSGTHQATLTQVQQALLSVLNQLATVAELTKPDPLARAIERSGLWLEAHLAQVARDPGGVDRLTSDLKGQLLALAQALRRAGARPADLPAQTADPAPGDPEPGPLQGQPLPLARGTAPPASTGSGAPSLIPSREGSPNGDGGPSLLTATDPAVEPAAADRQPPDPAYPEDGVSAARQGVEQGNPRLSTPDLSEHAASRVPALPDELGQQRPVPEQLRLNQLEREVEAMIKQVITRQLQSLDSPAGQLHWLMELPFQTASGVLALEADIQRAHHSPEAQPSWTIQLRLDLPQLGPLQIRLTLCEARLHGCFQAAESAGAELIRNHLDELRARLEARDIAVAALYAGQRPIDPPTRPGQIALFSERA